MSILTVLLVFFGVYISAVWLVVEPENLSKISMYTYSKVPMARRLCQDHLPILPGLNQRRIVYESIGNSCREKGR